MTAATVPELLSARPPDGVAAVAITRDGAEECSRGELLERAGRLAAGLVSAGLDKGDRIALVAHNSVDWVAAALGVMQAGGVVVPLDTQMPLKEFHFVLRDAQPRWVFTTGALVDRVIGAEVDPEPTLYRLDGDERAPEHWRSLWADEPIVPDVAPEDLATMFYTSGTTGAPKGVPLTHKNLASNVSSLVQENVAGSDDRVLVPLPFHHVYPFTVGILVPLRLGAPLILPFSLVGPQIVRALQLGQPTIMLGVPRLYDAVWTALEDRVAGRGAVAEKLFHGMLALSMQARKRWGLRLGRRLFRSLHQRLAPSLRMVVSGGAALDPTLTEKLRALGWEVATGYGLSETAPILTYNPPERLRVESAGMALPGVELAIDPPGEIGEVLARGDNVFHGYWRRPDKTREVLQEDGWFRTGDLGELDGDGYLYLQGRRSAMIVLPGGENIDPERVEGVLSQAEGVREVGVLESGGRLVGVAVPEPALLRAHQGEALRERLISAVQAAGRALPSHHRPGRLQVAVDPLPRTRLGKLRRHELQHLYDRLAEQGGVSAAKAEPIPRESMAPEDQQLLTDPSAEATWEYLVEKYPDFRLTPDTSLSLDLGLDSLAWVNLSLTLRDRVGVEFDDDAIGRIETVRDLLREAAGAGQSEGTAEGAGDLVAELRRPESNVPEDLQRWLEPRSALSAVSARLLWALASLFTRVWVRVEVRGRLPDDGPVLIAPRHLSVLDPVVLSHAVGLRRMLHLRWAGWTGLLFQGPVSRWFSRAAGVLPVDPASAPRRSLALAAMTLQRQDSLVWFPEGARSPDGRLQPFQPGVGLLLRAWPVPVVPVWVEGTRELMPKGRRLPRFGRATVVVGEPISAERLKALGDDEHAIARLIHDEVAALEPGSPRS
ncbi:AMP-binding protein [Alkalilimnicola ehrlichii MLHE-1]|uniref:AMP-dependent synthetase and ligase n=1 Tax=Alkalilimnicola ehrlichii (strain ATCC BAA-1101 / DSM 17681 / MLHE-1) TaxID=187272 RepID=Q0A889_ALKEH|nr:AMP-binding protein [Alkalilimnicola ehrlichii]ABI56948.1 AMP-dependent synthetase and ligase [Alkalilimnicola ehrlichii MLHE-1]